jgi:hypothetical protein
MAAGWAAVGYIAFAQHWEKIMKSLLSRMLVTTGFLVVMVASQRLGAQDTSAGHSQAATKTGKTLPEKALEILRANDPSSLDEIVLTLPLAREYAKELKVQVTEEQLAADTKRMLDVAVRTLKDVRERTEKDGFDWRNAKLVSTVNSKTKKAYDPTSTDTDFDLYMTVSSGSNIVKIKLDGGVAVAGQHRIIDGFRLGHDGK